MLQSPAGQWLRARAKHLDEGLLIAVAAMVIGLWVFVETVDEVTEGETDHVDRAIVQWVADLPSQKWIDEAMRDFTAFGGSVVLTLVTGAAALYLLIRRKTHAAIAMLVAIVGGLVLSLSLKGFFQRDRPDIIPHGSHTITSSFPSGHAMLSAVVWLTLATMLARLEKSQWLKAYFICLGLFISFLTGISRVWLGVHWPTDVLAGWSAGLVWATVCWFGTRFLQRRGTVEPPSNAATGNDPSLPPKGV